MSTVIGASCLVANFFACVRTARSVSVEELCEFRDSLAQLIDGVAEVASADSLHDYVVNLRSPWAKYENDHVVTDPRPNYVPHVYASAEYENAKISDKGLLRLFLVASAKHKAKRCKDNSYSKKYQSVPPRKNGTVQKMLRAFKSPENALSILKNASFDVAVQAFTNALFEPAEVKKVSDVHFIQATLYEAYRRAVCNVQHVVDVRLVFYLLECGFVPKGVSVDDAVTGSREERYGTRELLLTRLAAAKPDWVTVRLGTSVNTANLTVRLLDLCKNLGFVVNDTSVSTFRYGLEKYAYHKSLLTEFLFSLRLCNKRVICKDDPMDIVKWFVANGVPVNGEEGDEISPVDFACLAGRADIVSYLIEQGALSPCWQVNDNPVSSCWWCDSYEDFLATF